MGAVPPSNELAKETNNLKEMFELVSDAYRDRAKLIANLQATIHDNRTEFETLKREHAAVKKELESAKRDLSRSSHEIALLVMHMEAAEKDILSVSVPAAGDYQRRYEKITNSTSWKITAPFRFIGRRLKRKK